MEQKGMMGKTKEKGMCIGGMKREGMTGQTKEKGMATEGRKNNEK